MRMMGNQPLRQNYAKMIFEQNFIPLFLRRVGRGGSLLTVFFYPLRKGFYIIF